jgi:hypothetical protein
MILSASDSVEVTPLQPPFIGDVISFVLETGQILAVSKDDAAKIHTLLGGFSAIERMIVLEYVDDAHIRVRVNAS